MEIEEVFRKVEFEFHEAFKRTALSFGASATLEMFSKFENLVPDMLEDAIGDIFAELAYRLGVDQ